jgi:hypothetical protein
MIRWRDNQNIIRTAAKAVNAMAAAVFLGVDSMISMSVFVFSSTFRLNDSCQYSHTTITLSATLRLRSTVISNKDLPSKCQDIARLAFRDKGHNYSLPSGKMTCVIECLFYHVLFVVRYFFHR